MVQSRSPESNKKRVPGWVAAAGLIVAGLVPSAGAWAADPSARPPQIAASAAAQINALQAIKKSKGAVQAKMDSRLYLAVLNERKDARLSVLTDFRFVKPEGDGRIPVDIALNGAAGLKPVLNKLESLDAVVRAKSHAYQTIRARVRIEDLETLAAMPEVRRVRQAIPAMTHKVNTSEGDSTHGAAEARGFFGVTGTGVKIGVLSDGVDSLATLQASGDLPAVQVLTGQAGSGDEGSAMLEIVHDLAPGATLAFATAITDEASFAQNILDLAAAGCNIIVDDIIYLDESPFQDGPVAQAVNTVTSAGVLYFSSAGNEGNRTDLTSGTWEGNFVANGTPPVLAGAGPVHDFGDGGQSITIEAGGSNNPPLLIWAEHYDLSAGSASTDYDLYDLNSTLTTVFDASTDVQDGVGGDDFPIEFIGGGAFSGERLVVAKSADGTTSSVPMFNLIIFRGELNNALATNGATRGHSSAAAAFSVAATPAASSFDGITPDGPFPGLFTAANESESFSSDGPRRIILDPAGVEITPGDRTSTGGVVRQKPDITAADGVSTAAPGFDPFYGTSAAAPHAAAIAALLKSAVPSLTPAQVRTHLVSSAIDIEAAGVDGDTGVGIVMAHAALASAGATPQPFLTVGAALPTQEVGDGDAYVELNETFSLIVPLTNAGGAGASGISAVLSSSTPGIVISSATSAYPDLAQAASGNNATPFRFFVGGAAACGGAVQFSLTVTYAGGTASPQTFTFSIGTGSPGTPVTFSYTGAPVPIPDGADLTGTLPGAPAVASLPVAGVVGNIYDVNLSIDGATCSNAIGSTTVGIDHTYVNDLTIALTSPGATAAMVINNTDGSGNNFCQTLLDDQSSGPSIQTVVTANAPFTGTFKPNALLAAFQGEVADGTWQLQAQDFYSGDTGNIRAFSLIVTPAVCNAPPSSTAIVGTKTVTGSFVVGGAVTYTVTLTNVGSALVADNAGNEFADVLPAGLTLVSASATSGTAVATVGTNTVTWNGAIAGGASVTITITATINAGTTGATITNQGTVSYDADLNGSNETTVTTDDPTVGGANDPTSFVVERGFYYAVAPCRALDTRSTTPIPAGGTLTVTLTGGSCGIPATATAVSLNATITGSQAAGFLTLFPADESAPTSSTLNFVAGKTRANNAVVSLAAGGAGTIKALNQSTGTSHLVIDVNGYFE